MYSVGDVTSPSQGRVRMGDDELQDVSDEMLDKIPRMSSPITKNAASALSFRSGNWQLLHPRDIRKSTFPATPVSSTLIILSSQKPGSQ